MHLLVSTQFVCFSYDGQFTRKKYINFGIRYAFRSDDLFKLKLILKNKILFIYAMRSVRIGLANPSQILAHAEVFARSFVARSFVVSSLLGRFVRLLVRSFVRLSLGRGSLVRSLCARLVNLIEL